MKPYLLLPPLLLSLLYTPPLLAASEADCAIWMCLPSGFGEGCGDAKKAFKKRAKRHQPSMPPFPSCEVRPAGDTSVIRDKYTSKDGVAAYVPTRTICIRQGKNTCMETKTIDEHMVKDRRCARTSKDEPYYPKGCTQTFRYAEVYLNGHLFGQTQYY